MTFSISRLNPVISMTSFAMKRLVKKGKSLFDPTHKNNLKTYKSMKPQKEKQQVENREAKSLLMLKK